MDCAERDRLSEILRVAQHELKWVVKERSRIVNDTSESTRFDGVIHFARQHEQQAVSSYYRHIVTHGCVSRMEIGSLLKEQLDRARDAHQAASAQFDSVLKNRPGELPHPDGTLHIQQVGGATRKALDQYMMALMRFSDFVASGTVPEDLLPPLG